MCARARERYTADRKSRFRRRRKRHARAAEPDHHRRAEVRDDEHPPLPRPPSRSPDVEAEGAQLLRRGAELGPRPRLVREPLRRPLQGARRVLAPLHQPAPLRRRRRADQASTAPTRGCSTWCATRSSGSSPTGSTRPAPATRPASWSTSLAPRHPVRQPLQVLDAAAALPRALRPRADRGDLPGGAADRTRGDDAPRLRVRRRRPSFTSEQFDREWEKSSAKEGDKYQFMEKLIKLPGFRSFDRNFDRLPESMRWIVEKVVHDPEKPPAPKPTSPTTCSRPSAAASARTSPGSRSSPAASSRLARLLLTAAPRRRTLGSCPCSA